jgi:hypothetical protein
MMMLRLSGLTFLPTALFCGGGAGYFLRKAAMTAAMILASADEALAGAACGRGTLGGVGPRAATTAGVFAGPAGAKTTGPLPSAAFHSASQA